MDKITNYSDLARRPTVATLRKLIWVAGPRFQGSGCSECAWVFKPSGSPAGHSLAEMMEIYERLRDKEFAAHSCAEHAKAKKATL